MKCKYLMLWLRAGEIFTKSGAAELVHGVNPWRIAAELEDVEIERWY
jgi:hypothetical protein